MTALAFALVACCAMVCGTVYAIERLRAYRSETWAARKAAEAHGRADAAVEALKMAGKQMQAMEEREKVLAQKVETLSAHVALRSM